MLLWGVTCVIAIARSTAAATGRDNPIDSSVVAGSHPTITSRSGRAPSRVQRDQIERRGVRGAVIGRVRDQLEMRQLAVAHFMQDLTRFGISVVVLLLCLQ